MDSPAGGANHHNNLEAGGFHRETSNSIHPGNRHYFQRTMLFAVVVATTFLLVNQLSAYPIGFFMFNSFSHVANISSCEINHAQMQHNSQNILCPDKELEKTLRKAAMKDKKTVIITTLNAAWTEPNSVFDLFLESFRIGNGTQNLLKHLVIGAMDRTAYSRCLEKGLHCYAIATTGVNFTGEAHFRSDDYLKMMWRRIDFLRSVLQMGYDFVFTDADIMWFRDPFSRFYPDTDFQIACDRYNGRPSDLRNAPNGGFNYVKSSNRTIQFYQYWYMGKDYFPDTHDQDVLNKIKFNPFIKQIGLEIRFLDTAYYSGFCEPNKDLDVVITMHANCCVGLDYKIHDLKTLIQDWKNYTSAPTLDQRNLRRSWTLPRVCHV